MYSRCGIRGRLVPLGGAGWATMPDHPATHYQRTPAPHASQDEGTDLSELLSQLAAGLGPATILRRLAVNLDAYFVLAAGRLILAEKLLVPASAAQAAAAGLDVQRWQGIKTECVLLTPRQGASA